MEQDIWRRVAQAIHENYRTAKREEVAIDDPALRSWDDLPDVLKKSNLEQAYDIPNKLGRIGCTIERVEGRDIVTTVFTKDQIEVMAQMEHTRWTNERLLGGWKLGSNRDVDNGISPYLRPWADLPEHAKQWDRETVRQIPELLAQVGLEIHQA